MAKSEKVKIAEEVTRIGRKSQLEPKFKFLDGPMILGKLSTLYFKVKLRLNLCLRTHKNNVLCLHSDLSPNQFQLHGIYSKCLTETFPKDLKKVENKFPSAKFGGEVPHPLSLSLLLTP